MIEYDVHKRAKKVFSKLSIGQRVKIDTLSKSLNSDTNKSIQVENLYDKMTGILLEPAIARIWISEGCKSGCSFTGNTFTHLALEGQTMYVVYNDRIVKVRASAKDFNSKTYFISICGKATHINSQYCETMKQAVSTIGAGDRVMYNGKKYKVISAYKCGAYNNLCLEAEYGSLSALRSVLAEARNCKRILKIEATI